jgi:hypothetical protein
MDKIDRGIWTPPPREACRKTQARDCSLGASRPWREVAFPARQRKLGDLSTTCPRPGQEAQQALLQRRRRRGAGLSKWVAAVFLFTKRRFLSPCVNLNGRGLARSLSIRASTTNRSAIALLQASAAGRFLATVGAERTTTPASSRRRGLGPARYKKDSGIRATTAVIWDLYAESTAFRRQRALAAQRRCTSGSKRKRTQYGACPTSPGGTDGLYPDHGPSASLRPAGPEAT